jgi:hypothetical protein
MANAGTLALRVNTIAKEGFFFERLTTRAPLRFTFSSSDAVRLRLFDFMSSKQKKRYQKGKENNKKKTKRKARFTSKLASGLRRSR